jgi:MYXO-CTERM domain-containing protein
VVTSREGWVWAWRLGIPEDPSRDAWWSDHRDEANTGRWTAAAPGPAEGPVPVEPGLGLVVLGALAWRRRASAPGQPPRQKL